MLRNPMDMAPAVHAEMVASGHENVRDFAAAWALQADRREGRRLPRLSWTQRRLIYGDVCLLGEQLQRLLSTAARAQVLALLLEDVATEPHREYLRVLSFLGAPDDGRSVFPSYNRANVPRLPAVTRGAFIATQLKRRLGVDIRTGLWRRLQDVNRVEQPRSKLESSLAAALRRHFEADVDQLAELLNRDLRHWIDA
jgi:hypothetical protein